MSEKTGILITVVLVPNHSPVMSPALTWFPFLEVRVLIAQCTFNTCLLLHAFPSPTIQFSISIQNHLRIIAASFSLPQHLHREMCYILVTKFSCGHTIVFDDQCGAATHNHLEPTQCTNLKTEEVNLGYICPNCDKDLSGTDEDLERILAESRPKWQEEFLGEDDLKWLSGLQIGEVDEANEQAEVAKAMRESITSQYGGKFSFEDFAPDSSWVKRRGISDVGQYYADDQAAESSSMGAARNPQPSSRASLSIPPLRIPSQTQDNGLPPVPGPPPNRPLPPTPTTPTNPSPLRNPDKGKLLGISSPRSSPASPPDRYTFFPPPTSSGRPSQAPDLIYGVQMSPTRQHPATRTAGRPPTGGKVPPPVDWRDSGGQNGFQNG